MSRTVTLKSQTSSKVYAVPTVAAWNRVAKIIVKQLAPGSVVALSGPLGAGKTTFVQALAHELGIQRIPSSPTFALMRSYQIPHSASDTASLRRLIHVDAYRLEKPGDLLALDLDEELADRESALVIEWPERAGAWIKRQKTVIWMTIAIDS